MINVAIAPDDNYVMPAAVTVTSVLENKREDVCIYLVFLRGELSVENQNVLERIVSQYSSQMVKVCIERNALLDFPVLRCGISTYLRLYLPTALPQVEKIIYLDCDTIADVALDELYHTDISHCEFAGVADLQSIDIDYLKAIGYNHLRPYICAGVILMNLELLRQFPLMEKIREYLKEYRERINLPDQDIINVLFPDILILHPKYMVNHHMWYPPLDTKLPWTSQEIKEAIRHPSVIHYYAQFKPWYKGVKHKFRKRWYHYASLTPFCSQLPIKDRRIEELAKRETINTFKYQIVAHMPIKLRKLYFGRH